MDAKEIEKILADNHQTWGFTKEFFEESAKQIMEGVTYYRTRCELAEKVIETQLLSDNSHQEAYKQWQDFINQNEE